MSLSAEDNEHWGRACDWVHFDHMCWPSSGPNPEISAGNLREAKAELDRITPEGKREVSVLKLSAYVYGQLKDGLELATAAAELARLFPDEPEWVIKWASGNRLLRSFEDARKILTKAEKIYPGNAGIQFELAAVEAQLGNLQKGRQHLFRATAADPSMGGSHDHDIGPLFDGLTHEEMLVILHLSNHSETV